MSKAQLSGIVGYTGYIRPSLQCTQLSSLKPGRHANQAGSFVPQGVNPLPEETKPRQGGAGPVSMMQTASNGLQEESYAAFQRQDRVFLENSRAVCNRAPASTAHWKSMAAASFTGKAPDPAFVASFRPELQTVPYSPSAGGPGASDGKARTFKDVCSDFNNQAASPPKSKMMSQPRGDDGGELADMSMTWPRKGSREQLIQRPASHERRRHQGTTKASSHPPGYMGFIPSPTSGMRANEHGRATRPRPTQRCKEDTLFDSFREKPVGYLGYQPTSVYNRRTWEIPDITTTGAVNKAMVGMGQIPKRPEARNTSTLLDESFSGPLDGRPSDNGVFNSQIYYKLVRPLEGAARSHIPSMTHPAGRKFLKPYLTMKNF